ncbi:MAG: hypothetical protein ACRD9S_22975, partial [Pyrinomonadaceae bacterium]
LQCATSAYLTVWLFRINPAFRLKSFARAVRAFPHGALILKRAIDSNTVEQFPPERSRNQK